jgi:hypothetical protein
MMTRWCQHTLPEQFAQTQRPHNLQWCRLLRQPNGLPQRIQHSDFPSGIQTAGTKCSTLPRLGLFCSSSGRCGKACSVLLKWFVDVDDERVEFGRVTFNDASKAALAFRIAVLHSSRSPSLAVKTKLDECKVSSLKNDLPAYTANEPSGLHTSSLHSSPTSVGGVTTISKSTSSALPLNHHLSSQLALLPWRFFTLDGLTILRLGGMLGLGRVGDVGCDDGNNLFPEPPVCTRKRSADSSASLRLRERTITGRGERLDLIPFHSQRSAASLSPLSRFAIQRRQSENRRKSRSFGNEPPSSWKSEPRLRKVRPGAMSWKGRLGVLRWRARRSRV